MSTAEKVLTTLESVTGESVVRQDPDLDLFGLQLLDSLRSVELLVMLNESCGTEVSLSEIDPDSWATPRRIVAFIENRIGA